MTATRLLKMTKWPNFLMTFLLGFTIDGSGQVPLVEKIREELEINDVVITKKDIVKKIKKLNPSSAPGIDNLSAHLLQDACFGTYFCSDNFQKVFGLWRDSIRLEPANTPPIYKKRF